VGLDGHLKGDGSLGVLAFLGEKVAPSDHLDGLVDD